MRSIHTQKSFGLAAAVMLVTTNLGAECIVPNSSDIIAWWPFDETGGTVAADVIGLHDAQHVGAGLSAAAGTVANGLEFDGFSYLSAGDDPAFDFGETGSFTIELWVRPDFPGGDAPSILSIIDKQGTTVPNGAGGFALYYFDNCLHLQINDEIGQSTSGHYLGGCYGDGFWDHVAVTVNRLAGDGIKFYHNGNLIFIHNPLPRLGFDLTNDGDLLIGAMDIGHAIEHKFRGTMDELVVYDRVLTQSELTQHFLNGPDGLCKPDFRSEQSRLERARDATFTASGVLAGETVTWVRSLPGPGAGPCPPVLGGLCLDVLAPVVLGSAVADANGEATLTVPVPFDAPDAEISVQAAVVRGAFGADSVKSNVTTEPIVDPPCGEMCRQ